MASIRLNMNCDTNPEPDIAEKHEKGLFVCEPELTSLALIRIPRGMKSGEDSVMVRIDLPDGRVVLSETSMALLQNSVNAFKAAREGEEERAKKAQETGN